MNNTLGTLIRDKRRAQGLSLRRLAVDAGISPAALSNWETGKAQPRIPELNAVLDALRCSESQRQNAYAGIDAPRALAELRKSLPLPASDPEPQNTWFPSSGDFLRSLRLRRQLSQEQASALLHVRPSTLSRWEASKTRLPESALNAYCAQMAISPEERRALTHLFLAGPREPGDDPPLAALEQQLEALLKDTTCGLSEMVDLRFFLLESQIWPQTGQRPSAWELLTKTYVWHAQWLLWQDRLGEAGQMAKRALRLEEQARIPSRHWFRAGHVYATYLVDGAKRPDPRRGVRYIQDCLPLARWPQTEAWMQHNLATYLARAGQPALAISCTQRARDSASRSENLTAMRHAHGDTASIFLRVGQYEAAHDALAETGQYHASHNVYHRTYEAHLWAATLQRLGDISAADGWRIEAQKIEQTHRLPSHHLAFSPGVPLSQVRPAS